MGRKRKTIVTHLEMLAEPRLPPCPRPQGKFALMRAENPPVHFYRYLYDAVGRDYFWVNRKRLSDEALARIIHDPEVMICVLYCGGSPAGYFELDFRNISAPASAASCCARQSSPPGHAAPTASSSRPAPSTTAAPFPCINAWASPLAGRKRLNWKSRIESEGGIA
jgi:hypothetical protein